MSPRAACPKCQRALEEAANFCPACGEDLRGLFPNSDTLSGSGSGRVIDNRYRLKEKLGEGGMGAVFKAEHLKMGKVLALKLLRPDLAKADAKLATRFHQEARVVSKLSHPNTVQVFDYGEIDDGSLYLAMEFLPGRDLAWTLRKEGALPEERVIRIGLQVLSSLAEAHEHNIIHRDIKPANVMLIKQRDRSDWVKVLDFGIAKLNESDARKNITGVADFVGTPAYMSPEQAKGEPLDPRSDIYSVGAMLFELLTGKPVFDGPSPMAILTRALQEPPPRMHDLVPGLKVSPALEALVRRALAKHRDERFRSADEMSSALEKLRREQGHISEEGAVISGVHTQDLVRREDFDRFERRMRIQRAVVPLLVLGALGAGGYGAFRWFQERALAAEAPLDREHEPNNDPGHTNHIALGAPVHGQLGKPLSSSVSDRDLYELDVPEAGPLSVKLSGIPELNLVLEVLALEEEGGSLKSRSLLLLDDGAPGEGERVDGLHVPKGQLLLRVEEHAHRTERDRHPRESSQPYSLSVSPLKVTSGGVEQEPNDSSAQATVVASGKSVSGFVGEFVPLDRKLEPTESFSTVDFFRFSATAESPAPAGPRAFVVVVPPAQGLLLVRSSGAARATPEKKGRGRQRAAASGWTRVEGTPALVPVELGPEGVLLEVRPGSPLAVSGGRYQLALASDGEQGLASVAELLRQLVGDDADAATGVKVLELVQGAMPGVQGLDALEGLARSALKVPPQQ